MTAQLNIASTIKLNDGNEIPRLGFGVYKALGEKGAVACKAALEVGYRHIDGAAWYENEEVVGKAVNAFGREKVFVTSKIFNDEHGYESTLKVVDRSLARFGFTYLDLYLIHDPTSGKEKRLETWQALVEAKKLGKVKSIGVSNYNVKHLEEIREAGLPTPAINQIELHPYCQQRPITEYCAKHGIVVSAYAPLIRGEVKKDVIQEIADKKAGGNPFQVLVRWSLQRGFVPLPKSENPDRIKANADVYGFELSAEEMAAIDALDKGKEGAITWNPIDAE